MHEKFWAGVELKLQHADFHFRKMEQSLQRPEHTSENAALQASGAMIDTGWQHSVYAHLDAFLSAARSVPEKIQCCFGVDQYHVMKIWFKALPTAEQDRRNEFKKQFKSNYEGFRALHLGTARHISEHRTGVAPVTLTISGRFGVTYIGDPANHVPTSEIRHTDDPSLAWMIRPNPIEPTWADFEIEGKPLFSECQDYLGNARTLTDKAKHIVHHVHGTNSLTYPPS